MIELLCRMFLLALFVFYTGMVVALLGRGVQKGMRNRLKKARRARAPKGVPALALSPQTHRN